MAAHKIGHRAGLSWIAAFLRALTASIEQQVDTAAIDVEADEIELGIRRAVPLGLILNEAVTKQRNTHSGL